MAHRAGREAARGDLEGAAVSLQAVEVLADQAKVEAAEGLVDLDFRAQVAPQRQRRTLARVAPPAALDHRGIRVPRDSTHRQVEGPPVSVGPADPSVQRAVVDRAAAPEGEERSLPSTA